jgi:ankyrin repeat protein
LSQEKLHELVRLIASHDTARIHRLLAATPVLAKTAVLVGASAQESKEYFFESIQHYVYAGDTALHMAAASHDAPLCERLIALGADVAARNRRGAQPLHYAADTNHKDVAAQRSTIVSLCAAGAAPDALDKSGVAPLHRAVRTRGATAASALLESGADARLPNKSGSTPLHLAVQNTGRGGSASKAAVAAQREIIQLLLAHGARPSDRDARGTTALAAARTDWIIALLKTAPEH